MSNETEHPANEPAHPVYRTSASRTGKMLAIMLGICIVGGVIFFAMWDYWISEPAPVVAMMAGEDDHAAPAGSSGTAAAPTGVSHEFTLDFVESDDFRTLAFNALPGEDGHNPEIRVNSGDDVTITTNNMGKSFHSFGVVSNPEDFNSVIWDSAIATMSNPLKPGEGDSTTFTAGAPGAYYYICTIPGHALQGMQGSFIVE